VKHLLLVLVLTLGVCLASVGCYQKAPEEDYQTARIRMLAIETAEVRCQTELIGQMRDSEAKVYCHEKFQPQWDQWTHEFPNAARERALARQQ
jgi:hypothetical protein